MPQTVLILEDSATQAAIIGKLFERVGYHPTCVSDHAGAVAQLKVQRWDLLAFDVFLGDSNTLEQLDLYRKLAPMTPIAIMTAGRRDNPMAISQALNKARRNEVDFLLPKPFNFDDIQQICKAVAARQHARPQGNGAQVSETPPAGDDTFYL